MKRTFDAVKLFGQKTDIIIVCEIVDIDSGMPTAILFTDQNRPAVSSKVHSPIEQ